MQEYLDPKEKFKSNLREITAISLIFIISIYFFLKVDKKNATPLEGSQTNILNNQKSPSISDFNNTPKAQSPQKVLKEETVFYETKRYQLEFSSAYATLKKVKLKDYKNAQGEIFDITPNTLNGAVLPLSYNINSFNGIVDNSLLNNGYNVKKEENRVVFTQEFKPKTSPYSFLIEKIYSFKEDSFDVHLAINIKEKQGRPLDINVSGNLLWGKGLGPFIEKEKQIQYDKIITLSSFDTQEKLEEITDGKKSNQLGCYKWVAMDNRYFMVALIPFQKNKGQACEMSAVKDASFGLYNEVLGLGSSIAGNKEISQEFIIYMGPKNGTYLKSYGVSLERITERGWFFFPLLGSILMSILAFIKSLVGSYGLAIILFSVLLRLAFQPLNKQSMIAMSKQGDLQAKLQVIKERFPDKETQNAKIMELYRQEGANPLKGCFPLIIQIPFFIAFYRELPGVVELAQSQFLWIKDLSSPDTLFYIEAFKNIPLLPYRFNLLPILISLVTFLQTAITSQGQASNPQTKLMSYMMPFIFIFILWNAPSGLNLYWFAQTAASIVSQLYFNKNKEKILLKEKNKRKKNKKLQVKNGK